ncbi:hypothetical protein [Streptodolium elevatio]|uniref:Uncharacterized protein n=1 Tax=Streptodolium elevatio TaxID=3157996 RepID=A0ABV3DLA8_9ACTN
MAVYYEAKALRDLGRSAASARGMRIVAAGGGRLAPAARRGLAHLARLAGDFPTALDVARTLGWEGRHHRVEGDVLWLQGDIDAAAAAYGAARDEAEQHGIAGERATSQTHRAFVLAFTDPGLADDEIDLAHQLLTGLDLRATGFTLELAELTRDAGHIPVADFGARVEVLRTRMRVAGLAATQEPTLDLVVTFQQAVAGAYRDAAGTINRLGALTSGGDYAYYTDIAYFMIDRALDHRTRTRWIDGEPATRQRWHDLVTSRRARRSGQPV